MKKLISISIVFVLFFQNSYCQVSINNDGSLPHGSAQLDVKSANKGLLLPRVNTPASTITTPAAGLLVYNQTSTDLNYFNGSSWQSLANSTDLHARFPNSNGYPSNQGLLGGLNYREFNWVVPAGITKIWVEAWAGGDCGGFIPNPITNTSQARGGQAGDFGSFIMTVTPAETINIRVGIGGTSTAGGNTTITGTSGEYEIRNTSNNVALNGSISNVIPGLIDFKKGEQGSKISQSFQQFSATEFYRVVTGGDGGKAYPNQPGGQGAPCFFDTVTGVNIGNASLFGSNGATPGGGGGVGLSNTGNAGFGGAGYVIVHW